MNSTVSSHTTAAASFISFVGIGSRWRDRSTVELSAHLPDVSLLDGVALGRSFKVSERTKRLGSFTASDACLRCLPDDDVDDADDLDSVDDFLEFPSLSSMEVFSDGTRESLRRLERS